MHHFAHGFISDNFISRIDPRVKLLSALVLLVMVISGKGFILPLATAGFCVAICLRSGIRPKTLALRFVEPGFIIMMVLFLKLFFSGHSPIFAVRFLGLNIVGFREGLLEGLLIASRITGAMAIVTTIGLVTPFTELMAAFAWLRVPRVVIEVSHFAWRYLFLLFDDAKTIYGAQKNRLGYTGYRQGLRSFGALTGSLVIKAFDNSRNVTTAMVQRGYDGAMPMLRHNPIRFVEVAASLTFLVCMGVLWNI